MATTVATADDIHLIYLTIAACVWEEKRAKDMLRV